MKKKINDSKLVLKKETISILNNSEMNNVKGGSSWLSGRTKFTQTAISPVLQTDLTDLTNQTMKTGW
ncbi:MAG: class I lanthipeptide [Bacteroidota bacterium]